SRAIGVFVSRRRCRVSFSLSGTPPSPIYSLSLHDALPILAVRYARLRAVEAADKRVALVFSAYPTKHARIGNAVGLDTPASAVRSEEHTSELQSRENLVCRLLLEKKNKPAISRYGIASRPA